MGLHPDYIKEFYTRHISNGTVHGKELRALCPGHEESKPSFSVNLETGLFHCFSPKCPLHKGGKPSTFLAFIENIPVAAAKEKIKKEHDAKYPSHRKTSAKTKTKYKFPYTQEDIKLRMNALFSNEEKLAYLRDNCLWTDETLKQFEIGYNEEENAYWVPIKENGSLVNIRKYIPNGKMKWFSVTNFGEARLFPLENTNEQELYIMEGEKDCILANQLGLTALCGTVGAGTFPTDWKKHFVDKDVVVCYDCDSAGRDGAQKVRSVIGNVTRSLKIVDLGLSEPANADFTDYMRTPDMSIATFHDLVRKTEVTKPITDCPVDIGDEVVTTGLDMIAEKNLFYTRSNVRVRIIGADSSPYIIPRSIKISCNMDNNKACFYCDVGDKGGKDELDINETTPRLLDLIECSAKDRHMILREIFHIPSCRKFKVKERDHQSVHRLSVIPAIEEIKHDEVTQNQTYVERELYFIGPRLVPNTDYIVETLALPSPKDQSLVHLGYNVRPADSSIEEFKMTPELKNELGIFQCVSETN